MKCVRPTCSSCLYNVFDRHDADPFPGSTAALSFTKPWSLPSALTLAVARLDVLLAAPVASTGAERLALVHAYAVFAWAECALLGLCTRATCARALTCITPASAVFVARVRERLLAHRLRGMSFAHEGLHAMAHEEAHPDLEPMRAAALGDVVPGGPARSAEEAQRSRSGASPSDEGEAPDSAVPALASPGDMPPGNEGASASGPPAPAFKFGTSPEPAASHPVVKKKSLSSRRRRARTKC
jgi:hypothetical protein